MYRQVYTVRWNKTVLQAKMGNTACSMQYGAVYAHSSPPSSRAAASEAKEPGIALTWRLAVQRGSFRRQWVAGQCRNRCRSRGGSRLRRQAAPSRRGCRNRVIWGVGSLKAVSRHVVDPVSQLQVENMCGPLQ
jgi:hypothetical protein